MNIVATNMTVADYCQAMERNELIVNREYQRSPKVWPDAARSFLIETILLGYQMPKLSLYQVTDLKSRKTFKEIVDGQQRSSAIFDFYSNSLRLSKSLETVAIAGKIYSELENQEKQRFLDYQLTIDLFVATVPDEVREIFRRINSYTVPLNPEEHRHAIYQGAFKWFVNRIAGQFDESFINMELFGSQQIVRMADTKLITELCYAFLNGITTTTKTTLDNLYRLKDKDFEEESALEQRLQTGFDQLIDWADIHRGPLMKPHQVYSLALAISHMRKPCTALQGSFESTGQSSFERSVVLANLTSLADALVNEEEAEADLKPFVLASSKATNVRANREERFRWYCKALLP